MADQGNEGILSPWLRRMRVNTARPYLRGRVLDVGCGSGALASMIESTSYVGVEIDRESLDKAKLSYPSHIFCEALTDNSERFDTVVSLAVIEHVSNPARFLGDLARYLRGSESRLVITTPHPSMNWVHDAGAAIGLFSKHANEEHEELLDRTKLEVAGRCAGLSLLVYKRFLFGANQIAVFRQEAGGEIKALK